VVVGNLDLWVVNKRWETHEPHSPHQAWMFEMAKQTRELLSEDQLHWLGNLPFSITYTPELGHDFFIFHGTPHDIGDDDAIPLRLSGRGWHAVGRRSAAILRRRRVFGRRRVAHRDQAR
jgi:hypothetical protein